MKKNLWPNRKQIILLNSRINEEEVPDELMEDYKHLLKTSPVIIKSCIYRAC